MYTSGHATCVWGDVSHVRWRAFHEHCRPHAHSTSSTINNNNTNLHTCKRARSDFALRTATGAARRKNHSHSHTDAHSRPDSPSPAEIGMMSTPMVLRVVEMCLRRKRNESAAETCGSDADDRRWCVEKTPRFIGANIPAESASRSRTREINMAGARACAEVRLCVCVCV